MSRFYAKAKGDDQKTTATRAAQRALVATINGWDLGLTVWAWTCSKCGGDRFNVQRNGGSNESRRMVFITEFCSGCHEEALATTEATQDGPNYMGHNESLNAFGEGGARGLGAEIHEEIEKHLTSKP